LLSDDDTDAIEVVDWWLSSTSFDPFSGQPLGPPEWPLKGGMFRQPAVLVEAVRLLRSEWAHVERAAPKPNAAEKPAPEKKRGRR
jgi:hypothetical protein